MASKFFLVVLLSAAYFALADSGPLVGDGWAQNSVELTDDSWESKVMSSGQNWIVLFYHPGCGPCKQMKPEWEKTGKLLKDSNVKVGHLNGDQNKDTDGRYNIRGYPTILYLPAGDHANQKEYQGKRKANLIAKWAKQQASQ